MSLAACISRWPATTRWPWLAYLLLPTNRSSTDSWASLACRNSGSWSSRPSSSRIQARVPTLPTPTTLRATWTYSKRLEQLAAVGLQGAAVGPDQGAELAVDVVATRARRDELLDRHDQGRVRDDPALAVDLVGELGERLHAVAGPGLGHVGLGLRLLLLRGAWPSAPRRSASTSMWAYQTSRLRAAANCCIRARYSATPAMTTARRSAGANPRSRPAISKLAASRLTSHSHGPGSVSSKSLMSNISCRSGEANTPKFDRWASPQIWDVQARARGRGQVGRHDQRRAAVEGERRDQHPPVADRDQLGDPGRRPAPRAGRPGPGGSSPAPTARGCCAASRCGRPSPAPPAPQGSGAQPSSPRHCAHRVRVRSPSRSVHHRSRDSPMSTTLSGAHHRLRSTVPPRRGRGHHLPRMTPLCQMKEDVSLRVLRPGAAFPKSALTCRHKEPPWSSSGHGCWRIAWPLGGGLGARMVHAKAH